MLDLIKAVAYYGALALGGLIVVIIVWAISVKRNLARRKEHYVKQGVQFDPEATNLFGSLSMQKFDPDQFNEERLRVQNFKSRLENGIDKVAKKINGKDRFDGADLPIVGLGFFFKLNFMIADPEVMQDLMTVRNKQIDRDVFGSIITKIIVNGGFLTCKDSPDYRAKRKVVAQAFFRDKMALNME